MLSIIRERLDPSFAPVRALDFGCGVGRLLIPLATRCPDVTGVDVSPSMLAEARRNCDAAGATEVRLLQGDDELSEVTGLFDFVHSYIVLQHIPVERGERLVRKLAAMLAPGGVGMVHVTYRSGITGFLNRLRYWARLNVPGARWVAGLARGRARTAPVMQMNEYSITRLLELLCDEGCREVHVRFSGHGSARGVLLFARKSATPIFG
jgi:SAM-dependent methyltransferase